MITVTAFRWVPPFAQGHVRDLRVRWALEEAGIPYRVRLIGMEALSTEDYRAQQPFGQVPVMEEDGLAMFESGAIVLRIAERSGSLLPSDPAARGLAISWLFAALNSVEPPLMNLAEVDHFLKDEGMKAARRPIVLESIRRRLTDLDAALGGRDALVGGFTAADLMMTTVLRILDGSGVLEAYPRLAAYRARHEARPAFARALAGQLSAFRENAPAG